MSEEDDSYEAELTRLRQQRLSAANYENVEEEEESQETKDILKRNLFHNVSAPKYLLEELQQSSDDASSVRNSDERVNPGSKRIIDRQNAYQLRQRERVLSPERRDVFASSGDAE